MDYIQRLPFIAGATVSIIVGTASYIYNVNSQKMYTRMAISMVVFYILGSYVRSIIVKIDKEVKERKLKEEMEERERAIMAKHDEQKDSDKKEGGISGMNIDLKADGDGEEFTPFKVSEIIKSSIYSDENS